MMQKRRGLLLQGKHNFFPKEWILGYYISANGMITVENGFRYSNIFKLPSGEYRFYGVNLKTTDTMASNTRIHAYNQYDQWQKQLAFQLREYGVAWDFTFVIETDTYVRISTVDNVGDGSLTKI